MTEREEIERHIQSTAGFDAGADDLTELLDSVALLQLIVFIEQQFEVVLDLGSLTLDDFRSVDAILAAIEGHRRAG